MDSIKVFSVTFSSLGRGRRLEREKLLVLTFDL